NPQDSVALLRIINTPSRGIGKNTLETLERLALETGVSLWGALAEAINRQLLPARAVAALKSFRELIEDARAMLAGSFVEQVSESAEAETYHGDTEARKEEAVSTHGTPGQVQQSAISQAGTPDRETESEDTDFNPTELGENIAFDFGANTDDDTD